MKKQFATGEKVYHKLSGKTMEVKASNDVCTTCYTGTESITPSGKYKDVAVCLNTNLIRESEAEKSKF